jgi:aminoglycoside phosphotransferase (APT) family kinase protein
MATILRKLHAIPDFPEPPEPLFDYMLGLIDTVKSGISVSPLLLDYFEQFKQLQAILRPHLIFTSSHHDLNSKNLLFNGERTYVIDWEAAGMADPFFDLATVCNEFIFENEALTAYFLHQYFDRSATAYERAKIFLMQQVSHAYLGTHYVMHAKNAGLSLADVHTMPHIPTIPEWEKGYHAGRYALTTPEDWLLYGMTQIKGSLDDMSTPRFEQACEILKAKPENREDSPS